MSAATVTAVAAVAAAGVSAYSAYSSSSAGGEGGDAGKYGSKVKPEPYNDRIATEESYARTITAETSKNLEQSLPGVFDIANKVNSKLTRQRNQRTGGAFSETQRQEGANILAMERGQIPQDVIDSINKIVAESLGGAFNPSSGGVAGAGFDMSNIETGAANRLGLTSLDIMGKGMAYAPAWRTNVDSFLYKPQDAMKDFYIPTAQIGLDASKIQLARDEAEYISANNIARAAAMPNPQVTGAANDALTTGATTASSIGNAGDALAGLITAFGSYGGGGSAPVNISNPTSYSTPGQSIPLSTRPPGWNPSYGYI